MNAFASSLPARPFVLRACAVFIGLAALGVLIWVAGPLVAFGDWHPLESAVARALLIALLFAGWGARIGWRRWRAARLNAQLLNQLQAGGPASDDPKGEPAHLAELRQRFSEASSLLKTMGLAPGDERRSGVSGWIGLLSRRYLYQLPWYVFIGAPGSGKTTALVNSGLSFPLAEQFGKAAIRGVGGTRHCDWWFTNEAVMIDTAGRYTTQESNRALDEEEWRGFVGLLRKYRPRQPLNGALLTISVTDLLGASDAQRTGHAMALRKRLQELRSQLGIQFPVYVLVTKADLLAGFSEYFSALSRAERAQVWGFTFGLDESRAPDFDLRAAFDREYDLLHRRLDDALPELLCAESDVRRRELIYSLPQQFALLRDVLAQLIEEVFSQSKFGTLPMLRGVYLTSGTQEGTVFDRVMGGIKRFLQIDGVPPATQTGASGRSFFLKDLLQGLIVGETSLAGTNLTWHRRKHVLTVAGYSTAALLLCIALALWMRSYVNNSRYLDDVSARVAALDQQLRHASLTDTAGIEQVLPVLDDLRQLARTGRVDALSPPLAYRWGLFQGDKTRAAANGVYQRALDELLLPLAARRLEATLQSARGDDDPTFAYAALKAYLMLYDGAHYEPAYVQAVLELAFERTLTRPLTAAQRSALGTHLAALFADRVVLSPFAMNERLVSDTRARLQQLTFAQRLYAQLTRTLRGATQSYDFDIAHAGGPSAALVFRRQSGKSLNDALPGLYTYRGYWDVFDKRLDDAIGAFAGEEKWVLNLKESDVPNRVAAQAWARDIRTLYLDDYVRVWDAYLVDIRLQTGESLAQSIQAARVLSSPESPLTRLIDAAAAQTALTRSDPGTGGAGLADRAQDKVESARHALAGIFSNGQAGDATAPSDKLEAVVDNHFAGLRQFAHGENRSDNAPIEGMLKLVDDLYTYLSATDAALRSGGMPPPSDVPDKVRAQAGRMPAPFRQMLGDLADGANGSVATLAQRNLARSASADVGDFCRQAIAGRYPFAHGSPRDVALGDFAQVFAPAGLMDDFFRKNLQTRVDTATRPWRFNAAPSSADATANTDGITAGNAAPFLASFEKAAVIRDVFFAGGSRDPAVKVQIKPLDMDPAISEWALDAGGQAVRYAHGPQAPITLQWPAPGGNNQARLQVVEQSGATDGWVADGPWALYRLFDHARIERGRVPEELIASFAVDGKTFKVQITADSVHNPFRLAQMESFTCPGKS
ncbi:lipoprotein (plasmid) [Paraburkholderia sp. PGU19]|uniref:type VI secretion system membrane subunit TssM n=1 Tax=Paraburkholderia sp. PGU19 TaxID=2735434 RepID=UPI0015DBC6FA|nr:type VI secretion system membrane subunit TssM [Paraburkholderia sp. PGU19]BCG04510.1 lipoprotein [Paraburkholderia sp. PGU19]